LAGKVDRIDKAAFTINAHITGAVATVDSGNIVITSFTAGSSSEVAVDASSGLQAKALLEGGVAAAGHDASVGRR
jgi:hypothetical protein